MRSETDPRISWTVCGIRFVWGELPYKQADLRKCEECDKYRREV